MNIKIVTSELRTKASLDLDIESDLAKQDKTLAETLEQLDLNEETNTSENHN